MRYLWIALILLAAGCGSLRTQKYVITFKTKSGQETHPGCVFYSFNRSAAGSGWVVYSKSDGLKHSVFVDDLRIDPQYPSIEKEVKDQ